MKTLKKILKIFLIIIAIPVLGFIGLILYAKASDYKPDDKELSQAGQSCGIEGSTDFKPFNLEHRLCRTGQGYGFFQGWRNKSYYARG